MLKLQIHTCTHDIKTLVTWVKVSARGSQLEKTQCVLRWMQHSYTTTIGQPGRGRELRTDSVFFHNMVVLSCTEKVTFYSAYSEICFLKEANDQVLGLIVNALIWHKTNDPLYAFLKKLQSSNVMIVLANCESASLWGQTKKRKKRIKIEYFWTLY